MRDRHGLQRLWPSKLSALHTAAACGPAATARATLCSSHRPAPSASARGAAPCGAAAAAAAAGTPRSTALHLLPSRRLHQRHDVGGLRRGVHAARREGMPRLLLRRNAVRLGQRELHRRVGRLRLLAQLAASAPPCAAAIAVGAAALASTVGAAAGAAGATAGTAVEAAHWPAIVAAR